MTQLEKANQYIKENKVDYKERPAFHVSAPVGWINDPNGFSIYQNTAHLFFQFYPYDSVWGPMHWGHVNMMLKDALAVQPSQQVKDMLCFIQVS